MVGDSLGGYLPITNCQLPSANCQVRSRHPARSHGTLVDVHQELVVLLRCIFRLELASCFRTHGLHRGGMVPRPFHLGSEAGRVASRNTQSGAFPQGVNALVNLPQARLAGRSRPALGMLLLPVGLAEHGDGLQLFLFQA